MESSVTATIITLLGTGLIVGLGYFMKRLVHGIEAKIDKLEASLTAKIDKVEARVDKLEEKVDGLAVELRSEITDLKVGLAEIAATQQEHSAKLQHMMGHGERISALEGAVFGTGP